MNTIHRRNRVLMQELIINKLKSVQAQKIFKRFGLEFVYLYGSAARKQMMWWSDVDLAIYKSRLSRLSVDQKLRLLQDLIVSLSSLINTEDHPLDIRFVDRMPLALQFQIIKEGILIFNKSPKAHQKFFEYVIRNYADYAIWIENYLNLVYAS
ncbi:MAG: type VII toxin-antitoxin system MntA family adenylyltransferase antitoxin [Candidatus Ranarchaeia archaeon]